EKLEVSYHSIIVQLSPERLVISPARNLNLPFHNSTIKPTNFFTSAIVFISLPFHNSTIKPQMACIQTRPHAPYHSIIVQLSLVVRPDFDANIYLPFHNSTIKP